MRFSLTFFALLGLTSAASLSPQPRQASSGACNNSPDLCGKSYSAITHLGAHDSAFVRDATTGFSTSGNQYYNSTVQLSAGVRLLTAQVHQSNGQWHLCHSSCDLLDAGLLSTWLSGIKLWMDENPDDVVTVLLVNSDNATPAQLDTEFRASNITQYSYTPPSYSAAPASWPTLQSLINSGTRLMTFVASLTLSQITAETAYLMDEFTFIFENPFENLKPTDFNCDPNRPSGQTLSSALGSNRMPFMNHFLDQSLSGILSGIDTPDVDNITTTNSPNTTTQGMLGQSADNCTSYYNRAPTFILVDFFDQGPAIDTVDRLNGVTDPVGRTPVPTRSTSRGNNAASWTGVQQLVQQVKDGQTPSMGAWIWGAGKWSWGGINLSGGKVIQ